MRRIYELRHRDDTLLTFTFVDNGRGPEAVILGQDRSLDHLMPPDLDPEKPDLILWFINRTIPMVREFALELMEAVGIHDDDPEPLIKKTYLLSLNDCYWTVPAQSDICFRDVSLFRNGFSEQAAETAFTGSGRIEDKTVLSPEFTTGGMLRKAWRRSEDGICLWKGGTSGAANAGNEPFSEYFACQIAEAMGIRCVHYDLDRWDGVTVSVCRLFTSEETSYVPFWQVLSERTIENALECSRSLGSSCFEDLCSMIVFDAVIYDQDRHFSNFGLLRDNSTGKIKGMAPVFDNGTALFNFAMPKDLEDIDSYALTRDNPYGRPYDDICREIMGKKQKEQLEKLAGLSLRSDPGHFFPEERLRIIEDKVRRRAEELLSFPSVR